MVAFQYLEIFFISMLFNKICSELVTESSCFLPKAFFFSISFDASFISVFISGWRFKLILLRFHLYDPFFSDLFIYIDPNVHLMYPMLTSTMYVSHSEVI